MTDEGVARRLRALGHLQLIELRSWFVGRRPDYSPTILEVRVSRVFAFRQTRGHALLICENSGHFVSHIGYTDVAYLTPLIDVSIAN